MSDSATLLLGLILALAIPVVVATALIRAHRASSRAAHPGAHVPDPWETSAPESGPGESPTGSGT